MYCHKCGTHNNENGKYCKHCGVEFSRTDIESKSETTEHHSSNISSHKMKSSSRGKIITILVILAIVGFGIYGSVDKEQIATNNEALTDFDSGNSATAIQKFRQAANEATSNETKIAALKNLGYVYATEVQPTQALSAFNEALPLTEKDSFDYYLISGEIALLEGRVNEALTNYNNAYRLNPEDYQINNALALFHLDIDGVSANYADYGKAILYAKKANQLSPSEISKQNLAIAYYFNKNYTESINLLSSTNFTQHPVAAYWLGLSYLGNEDDVNARTYLQMAVDSGTEVPQEVLDYLNSN